ncbi:MAG: hypothetical protein AAFR93_14460 [Pseudomonadota bacterium]
MFKEMVLGLCTAMCASPLAASSLDQQLAAAVGWAARYASFDAAKRDGWRSFGVDVPLMGQHFRHPDGPDFVTGDRFDPTRPSNLIYAEIAGRKTLVALAYIVRKSAQDPLPEGFEGSRDIWHIHDGETFLAALSETRPLVGRFAGRWFHNTVTQQDGRMQLAMVHLWLIPNPKGAFASHNPSLAYLDLGLPEGRAGDMATARGLALAQEQGCSRTLDAELRLSGASRGTVRRIKRACRTRAQEVRASLGGPLPQIEAVAARAWGDLVGVVQTSLTPDEFRRSQAFVEDGPGLCREAVDAMR